MSNSQMQLVFSSFRKNISERFVCKRLKLINVKIKIRQIFESRFAGVGPRHCRQVNFCNDHASQKIGVPFADSSFGQIDYQNFPLVHDLPKEESAKGTPIF